MGNQQDSAAVKPPVYTIIGPQGSGKGTQARFITKRYHLSYLATGNTLREIAQEDTSIGRHIKAQINKGSLIPDEELTSVFKERLSKLNLSHGALLDGLPRTIQQAILLDKLMEELNLSLPIAIYLNISRETAVKRLLSRRICSLCQTTYLPSDESYKSGICAKCGGTVVARTDDNEQAIQHRLEQYYKEIDPIINYYRQADRLIEVNGEPPIPDVTNQIMSKLPPAGEDLLKEDINDKT